MKSKFPAFIEKIHPVLWQGICFSLSILVFSLILVNRNPNILRPLSMSLRTGFGLVIPSTALALFFLLRIPGRVGELIAITGVLSLFALPLAGVWASGKSQSVLFNGLIPLADAANYYIDSLRILVGWKISHFSAMRPIFPGFLSLLQAITGRNFMASLGILTAIAGYSAYFTSREVQRTHGAAAGTSLMILLFLFFRHHAGTSMSEILGMSVGVLGTGVIWHGLDRRSLPLSVFGLFALSLALNIRPGTMFVLPLVLLWIARIFRRPRGWVSLKAILWGMGVILISFFTNSLFVKMLADSSGTAFSNFS
jgi:hypothetical protein